MLQLQKRTNRDIIHYKREEVRRYPFEWANNCARNVSTWKVTLPVGWEKNLKLHDNADYRKNNSRCIHLSSNKTHKTKFRWNFFPLKTLKDDTNKMAVNLNQGTQWRLRSHTWPQSNYNSSLFQLSTKN